MITLKPTELEFSFIRSPGPGGQNVNKVATAVQLKFNLRDTQSLPEAKHQRVLNVLAAKITSEGYIVIKASRYRTQTQNKADALMRLLSMLEQAAIIPKKRKKTKPSKSSQVKRLDTKKRHGQKKTNRTSARKHDE